MKLDPQPVPAWPKLAWVATLRPGADKITIYHGPCVETSRDWCAEAVWAGEYARGDFDRTDLVFGSGLRRREHRVVFVSAGTTLDRLWYHRGTDAWHVANSLPALLAVAGTSLAGIPADYARDVDTIGQGLTGYKRRLPAATGELYVQYFHNLVWDGQSLGEAEKPDTAPRFDTFETYAAYLRDTAEQLATNMNNRARAHAVTPLVTVSQGYDSSAAAVVARLAGCRQSVTIRQSTSLWRGSDSGEEVAHHLGLDCATYDRTARQYPLEEAIWAVAGRASILNWTLFDYPQPLCLFFTGSYGDKMWSRKRREYRDPFQGTSLSHGGIGEFRLVRGVFHCPVPFWGMRHIHELQETSFSEVMQPWSVGGNYDRPIARRLVEEAGVPRTAFGQRKKNTSHDAALLWPYTPETAASFRHFLAARGLPAPGPTRVWLRRRTNSLAHLVEANVLRPFTAALRHRQEQATYAAADVLFHWANAELTKRYKAGLRDIEQPLP
ncbi:MAG: hypothetical protein WBD75_03675 [Phycisphaerae bacterium]